MCRTFNFCKGSEEGGRIIVSIQCVLCDNVFFRFLSPMKFVAKNRPGKMCRNCDGYVRIVKYHKNCIFCVTKRFHCFCVVFMQILVSVIKNVQNL